MDYTTRLGNAEPEELEDRYLLLGINKKKSAQSLSTNSSRRSLQKLRENFLLKVKRINESKLTQLKKLDNLDVQIKTFDKLNLSRGTILCPELNLFNDDEIREFQMENNITKINR